MNYLIKETTREERLELVEKALSISLSGADAPSDEVLFIVNQYIEGEKELEEVQKQIVKMYKEKAE